MSIWVACTSSTLCACSWTQSLFASALCPSWSTLCFCCPLLRQSSWRWWSSGSTRSKRQWLWFCWCTASSACFPTISWRTTNTDSFSLDTPYCEVASCSSTDSSWMNNRSFWVKSRLRTLCGTMDSLWRSELWCWWTFWFGRWWSTL